MKKFVAYYAETSESEFFDTIEQAIDWLTEFDQYEISEGSIDGENYIAEIKLVSHCPIIAKKSDVPEEEWIYGDSETIHDIKYVEPQQIETVKNEQTN